MKIFLHAWVSIQKMLKVYSELAPCERGKLKMTILGPNQPQMGYFKTCSILVFENHPHLYPAVSIDRDPILEGLALEGRKVPSELQHRGCLHKGRGARSLKEKC